MQDLQLENNSPDFFDQEKSDLTQAIETLCDVKNDIENKWARECFDVVIMALKDREAMQ